MFTSTNKLEAFSINLVWIFQRVFDQQHLRTDCTSQLPPKTTRDTELRTEEATTARVHTARNSSETTTPPRDDPTLTTANSSTGTYRRRPLETTETTRMIRVTYRDTVKKYVYNTTRDPANNLVNGLETRMNNNRFSTLEWLGF